MKRMIHRMMKQLFWQLINHLSDTWRVRLLYVRHNHTWPNLLHPTSFNEKVQWRKLHDRRPFLRLLCDKYRVRLLVREKVGEAVLPKVYWVGEHADALNLDQLPPQFVLKTNHGSGWVKIVRDKQQIDWDKTKAELNDWLSRPFDPRLGEWGYQAIKPLVYAEELLPGLAEGVPYDYKFFVFGGEVKMIQVNQGRFTDQHTLTLFDENWRRLAVSWNTSTSKSPVACPENFELMKQYAVKIAGKMDFLRVDFYNVEGKIYFGELAVYPSSGYGYFTPRSFDEVLGAYWVLPQLDSSQTSRDWASTSLPLS